MSSTYVYYLGQSKGGCLDVVQCMEVHSFGWRESSERSNCARMYYSHGSLKVKSLALRYWHGK